MHIRGQHLALGCRATRQQWLFPAAAKEVQRAPLINQPVLGSLVEKQLQAGPAAVGEFERQLLLQILAGQIARPIPSQSSVMNDQIQ